MVLHALFPDKDSISQNAAWFATTIREKIKEKSWQYVTESLLMLMLTMLSRYPNVPGNYVDIVKDVINIVSTHVAADKLVGLYNDISYDR
jgi:linoleate 10R-lipoxygenase